MEHSVRRMEELSLNAWPCLETVYYDGWVLRFAGGYTRRANSVNPIYPSVLNLNDKIAYCELIYAARELRTVFKITPSVDPSDLDGMLADRGYVKDAKTSVQSIALAEGDGPELYTVTIDPGITEDWLGAFCRLNNIDSCFRPVMRKTLTRIVPRTCFIRLTHQNQIVAVGLGMMECDCLGLFDLVVDVHLRHQGLGREIMLNLMQWGRDNGAHRAYLQVMLNNTPALRFYRRLGFKEIYQYWYRVKSLR